MNESDHARSGCELVSSLVWTRSQDCWSSVLCLAPDHASSGKAVKLNSVATAASFQAFFGLFLVVSCHDYVAYACSSEGSVRSCKISECQHTVPGQSMIFVLYNKYSSNYTVLG